MHQNEDKFTYVIIYKNKKKIKKKIGISNFVLRSLIEKLQKRLLYNVKNSIKYIRINFKFCIRKLYRDGYIMTKNVFKYVIYIR